MTKQEQKQQLRTIIHGLERQLSPKYKASANQTINQQLLANSEYLAAQVVFCYVSTDQEVDTMPILRHALASGKTLCVPRNTDDGRLTLHHITSLDALSRDWIITPTIDVDQVDFAILPCVSCNYFGQRLGQGGGHYDRFLAQYRGGTVLFCYGRLIREEIPLEPHDYPIPWVLTEAGLFEDGFRAQLG